MRVFIEITYYVGKSVVSLLSILTGERGLPLGKAKIQFHRNVKEGIVVIVIPIVIP
jgi:hypothetical protein